MASLVAMKKTLLAATALSLLTAGCTTMPPAPPPTPVAPVTAPGPDYLIRNGQQAGVMTTASGLQYFIIRSGPETGAMPVDGDTVTFHYEGKLTDGTTFDESYSRGEPLAGEVTRFVPGFTEALKMMRPGDLWVIWIPPELGYGSRELPGIPANSVLRFKLELLEVEKG